MPKSCVICNSSYVLCKKKGVKTSFHKIPKNLILRKKWLKFCTFPKNHQFNLDNLLICSGHFKESDFHNDMYTSLMLNKNKMKLNENAVPSIRHPKKTVKKDSIRSVNYKKRQNSKFVNELLLKYEQENLCNKTITSVKSDTKNNENVVDLVDMTIDNDDICVGQNSDNVINVEELSAKMRTYEKKIELMEQDITNYRNELKQKDEQILKMQQQLKDMDKDNEKKFIEKVKNKFIPVLTENQINKVLMKKRLVWHKEDICRAFSLRYLGRSSYMYLKNTIKLPLPGISTLQKWAATFKVQTGILQDVLNMIEVAGVTLKPFEKITVLCFDKIKVEECYEYLKVTDEILGPHKYMQVLMARGLFSKWKQPIYLDFDAVMSTKILNEAISKLHDIGYSVVGCVSDCGAENQDLWRELNISIENPSFSHCITGESIVVFGDAPHLLKFLRNIFCDSGFILPNGVIINKSMIQELINFSNTEISSTFKLSNNVVNFVGNERQSVSLAKSLFSHRTAVAIKRYFNEENYHCLADFIDLIDQWFHLFNSHNCEEVINFKKPYGTEICIQEEILCKMYNTISKMQVVGESTLYPFQKYILISINSLKMLHNNLKEKFPHYQFIMTHRLNQDILENLFSQLRTYGGTNEHLSPLNAIYRFRSIILGKSFKKSQCSMSTTDTSNDAFLTVTVFNKIFVEKKIRTKVFDYISDIESVALSCCSANVTQSEEDGIEYIAGFVAKKFINKYPGIGEYSNKPNNEESYVDQLSHGDIVPSKEWVKKSQKLEEFFIRYHQKNFQHKKKVIGLLSREISNKEIDWEKDLIKYYIKIRTYFRIKYLNKILKENKN